MLIWLASYPRSGNNFMWLILNRYFQCCTIDSYKVRRQLKKQGVSGQRNRMKQMISDIDRRPEPHFVKAHDLPFGDPHPAIYIVRDGRDVLVSYTWFRLEVDEGLERSQITPERYGAMLRSLIRDEPHFGSWSTNVRAWMERENTVVVRFENLIKCPKECVTRALSQLGVSPMEKHCHAPPPEFNKLQKRNPRIFRRGKIGSWEDEFPEDQLELFWQRHGDVMRCLGYLS